VTHACEDAAALTGFYPRGGPALRGPFTRFQPRDTVQWFAAKGVALKTEPDGRLFPVTDDSMTVVRALRDAAARAGVEVRTGAAVTDITAAEGFTLTLKEGGSLRAPRLLLATGGDRGGHAWARRLGHAVEPPVPSLFTFRVADPRLAGLAGLSVPDAAVRLENAKRVQTGPLLITHWGLSGPAVLKTSAWEARALFEAGYKTGVRVNWLPAVSPAALEELFRGTKTAAGKRLVRGECPVELPRRLWEKLVAAAKVEEDRRWADMTAAQAKALAAEILDGRYAVTGKGAFKDEFVTCGGVRLDEVDFRTLESRLRPGLYFAGEILDVDGLTGGFNFQNAWTTGWLAGRAAGSAGGGEGRGGAGG
jgi:predicted Rossmann fold flavoprotein